MKMREITATMLVVAMAGAASAQQQRPAQPQRQPEPIVIKPGERPEDVCRGDAAGLTCDIASNPRRGSINDLMTVAKGNADYPNTVRNFNDSSAVILAMKEGARQGWVADPMIAEYAGRGISRIRFREENGQVQRDAQGNPIIERDRAQDLAARIVGSALDNPDSRELNLGQGIRPVPINKPRVCIAAFIDINMRLEQTIGTVGKPTSVTNGEISQIVTADRAVLSDSQLTAAVNQHLLNRSVTQKVEDVVADCGQLALRQLHDEGFRYQGQFMTVPPTR